MKEIGVIVIRKIVDQNYLREPNPILHNYLSSGNEVVLSDYACMEVYKGNSILNTRRSLEIIRYYPNQVVILKNTMKIIKMNNHKSSGLEKRLIDNSITSDFHYFCKDVYSERIENPLKLESHLFKQLSREANTFFNERTEDTKKIIESIKLEKETFSKEELKELRKNRDIVSFVLNEKMERVFILSKMLMYRHHNVIDEYCLMINSFCFRFALAGYILSLKWIIDGGIENIKIDKLENDVIDMSYVAYGTYYNGVLTNDNKIKEIYNIAREILNGMGIK
jgi:hypothetical protein